MGIYDRDYNRDNEEGRSPSGFMGGLTPVVKWLLVVNFVVFVVNALIFRPIESLGGLTLVELYGSVLPINSMYSLQIWRLVTYQFLHADVWHLVFNMMLLYFMGPLVERSWGSRSFLLFYVVCGAAGAVVYTLFVVAHVMQAGMMVGASGAIYGIMAAVAYMFPHLRVMLWGVIPMTMVRLITLLVILSLLFIAVGHNTGGELAHLAGLGAGFLYMVYQPWMTNLRMTRQKGNWSRRIDEDRQFMKEVDEILDKVHREGIQSLSWHERHTLQEATRREQQNSNK